MDTHRTAYSSQDRRRFVLVYDGIEEGGAIWARKVLLFLKINVRVSIEIQECLAL